jgi:hypothetical protein
MRSLPGRWWSRGKIRAWPGRDPVIGLLTVPSGRGAIRGPVDNHQRGYSADRGSQRTLIADYAATGRRAARPVASCPGRRRRGSCSARTAPASPCRSRVPNEVGAVGMAGRSDQPAKRHGNGTAAAERRSSPTQVAGTQARVRRAVAHLSPVGAASSAVGAGCPAGMAWAPPAVGGSIVWASWPPPICTRRGLAAWATGIVSVSTPCS